jgi:CHASE3 domain sensor protein
MKNRRVFSDLLFLLIILFLAFASFISYQRITKQNEASGLVAHANLVKFKLGETISFLRLAEKKEQDSIHARENDFNLQLLEDSSLAYEKLYELDSLTRGDKDQQASIIQLRSMLVRWMGNMHNERERAQKLSADLSNYLLEGQSIVNRIQMLFIEMRHVEDDLLLQKIQEKDRTALLIPLYSLVFSFIAIFLVSGTYYRLRNETRLREKAEDGQAVIYNFFQQVPASLAILKGPEHIFISASDRQANHDQ